MERSGFMEILGFNVATYPERTQQIAGFSLKCAGDATYEELLPHISEGRLKCLDMMQLPREWRNVGKGATYCWMLPHIPRGCVISLDAASYPGTLRRMGGRCGVWPGSPLVALSLALSPAPRTLRP